MNLKLPKIYPVTDASLSGLSHFEQAVKLIDGGAAFIQLREKYASPGEFYTSAVAVIQYARKCCVRIIINDRVNMALAVQADGVHLGQDDMPPDRAREILGPEAIIGFSTHTIDQARAALLLPVDYIAIGPVFETVTKINTDDIVGLEGVARVRDVIGDFPLVAIGGIDRGNLNAVLDAGADSVAIVSAIVSQPDKIELRMRQFTALTG